MTEVVSVKFKNRGKTYYFAAAGNTVEIGQNVIVETSKGLEFAQCVMGNHFVPDEKVIPPIRPVVRVATENDLRVAEINKKREREAFDICKKKIEDHGLDMKLVDVECSFEGNKITFFFTSDGRVDFRELVKDLASVFRNRIELRQIGVRDEAKMLGGIGICGRPFCCSQFLDEFQPVSTKMAKIQSMSLNPSKISGTCGRLMCCLRYEEEAYENLVKTVPKNGAFVETPAGYGNVTQVNLLRRTVKVKLDGEGEDVFKTYSGRGRRHPRRAPEAGRAAAPAAQEPPRAGAQRGRGRARRGAEAALLPRGGRPGRGPGGAQGELRGARAQAPGRPRPRRQAPGGQVRGAAGPVQAPPRARLRPRPAAEGARPAPRGPRGPRRARGQRGARGPVPPPEQPPPPSPGRQAQAAEAGRQQLNTQGRPVLRTGRPSRVCALTLQRAHGKMLLRN